MERSHDGLQWPLKIVLNALISHTPATITAESAKMDIIIAMAAIQATPLRWWTPKNGLVNRGISS